MSSFSSTFSLPFFATFSFDTESPLHFLYLLFSFLMTSYFLPSFPTFLHVVSIFPFTSINTHTHTPPQHNTTIFILTITLPPLPAFCRGDGAVLARLPGLLHGPDVRQPRDRRRSPLPLSAASPARPQRAAAGARVAAVHYSRESAHRNSTSAKGMAGEENHMGVRL